MKADRATLVSVRCPDAPSAALCTRMSTRALVVVALKHVAVDPAKLARVLGVEPAILERARCVPDVLPLKARLTLASLVGFETACAPLARTLRSRTLRTLNRGTVARTCPATPTPTTTD